MMHCSFIEVLAVSYVAGLMFEWRQDEQNNLGAMSIQYW